jgi:IS66 C-terminal element
MLGRKNYLFCGSEGGGHRAALIYSLIESAKLNHLDPYAYFVDILTKLPTCRAKDLAALLPYRWQPGQAAPQTIWSRRRSGTAGLRRRRLRGKPRRATC